MIRENSRSFSDSAQSAVTTLLQKNNMEYVRGAPSVAPATAPATAPAASTSPTDWQVVIPSAAPAAAPSAEDIQPLLGSSPPLKAHSFIGETQKKSIKASLAKTIICLMLARSWTSFIKLVLPLAFGRPLEVQHRSDCTESLWITLVTFTLATFVLHGMTQLQKSMKAGTVQRTTNMVALQGIGTSAAFMWCGASFTPAVKVCYKDVPGHQGAALMLTLGMGTALSLALSIAHEAVRARAAAATIEAAERARQSRKGSASPDAQQHTSSGLVVISPAVLDVIAQALALGNIFIVVCTARAADIMVRSQLPWLSGEYVDAYLDATARSNDGSMGDGWVPINPSVVRLIWAFALDGLLTRFATALGARTEQGKLGAIATFFTIKLSAYCTPHHHASIPAQSHVLKAMRLAHL